MSTRLVLFRVFLLSMVLSVVVSRPVWAIEQQLPVDLSGLNNDLTTALIRTVALGADHRAYMPATPMGLAIGLDAGVDFTAVAVPKEFASALALSTGKAESTLPTVIPVPKLSLHKGFPGGFDLGFSYATSKMLLGQEDLFNVFGFDLKWAFIDGGNVKPAVAARFAYSKSKLWFMSTNTFSIDAVASKNLYVIDPYVGAGLKIWSGDLAIPVGIPGLPLTVSGSHSSVNPHIFAGLPFKMMLLRLTVEIDYNLAGMTSYGGKISFNF